MENIQYFEHSVAFLAIATGSPWMEKKLSSSNELHICYDTLQETVVPKSGDLGWFRNSLKIFQLDMPFIKHTRWTVLTKCNPLRYTSTKDTYNSRFLILHCLSSFKQFSAKADSVKYV